MCETLKKCKVCCSFGWTLAVNEGGSLGNWWIKAKIAKEGIWDDWLVVLFRSKFTGEFVTSVDEQRKENKTMK